MIEKENIRLLLVDNLPDYAPESISQIHLIQRNSFHIQHKYHPTFLKWIGDDDLRGNNEIQKYQEILTVNDICIPELIGLIPATGGVLGVWEWLEGTDLRTEIVRKYLMHSQYWVSTTRRIADGRHWSPISHSKNTRAFLIYWMTRLNTCGHFLMNL